MTKKELPSWVTKEEYPKTYKIEQGLSMPKRRFLSSSVFKQLRDEMEIGDSIVVDSHKKALAIYAYFDHHGRKTSTRKIGENQYRIWRVK